MVSRKPDAICLHCGTRLDQCEVEYGAFINMTEYDRNEYRENYKIRMLQYTEKLLKIRSIENKRTSL